MSEAGANKGKSRLKWFVLSALILLISFMITTGMFWPRMLTPRMVCGTNLKELGTALYTYALENEEKYPIADKWYDVLIEQVDVKGKSFKCPSVKGRGHYALNPDATVDSAADVVLAFETTGGWNQYGEVELLTADNHEGAVANVLFAGGYVDFVGVEDFGKLRWKGEAVAADPASLPD